MRRGKRGRVILLALPPFPLDVSHWCSTIWRGICRQIWWAGCLNRGHAALHTAGRFLAHHGRVGAAHHHSPCALWPALHRCSTHHFLTHDHPLLLEASILVTRKPGEIFKHPLCFRVIRPKRFLSNIQRLQQQRLRWSVVTLFQIEFSQ